MTTNITFTLQDQLADMVAGETKLYEHGTDEKLAYNTIKDLAKQEIDKNIDEGLADIKAGNYRLLTKKSGHELIDNLFAKHAR
jgi:predicted transcriptional regulator